MSIQNKIVGLGGTRSVHEVPPIAGALDHILALVDAAPRTRISETSVTFPGIVSIRTSGDVEIEGTVRGAGILVIDGEFEIDEGTLIWDGLVIVRGGDDGEELEIEEGKLQITGSLVILGKDIEEIEIEESQIKLQYSQAMLDRVVPPVPTGFFAINWRDGPNP